MVASWRHHPVASSCLPDLCLGLGSDKNSWLGLLLGSDKSQVCLKRLQKTSQSADSNTVGKSLVQKVRAADLAFFLNARYRSYVITMYDTCVKRNHST